VPRSFDRPANFAIALVLYLVFKRMMASPYWDYRRRADAPLSSLWGPGIAAIVGMGLVSVLLKLLVYRLLELTVL
jgi:hypothetical protein